MKTIRIRQFFTACWLVLAVGSFAPALGQKLNITGERIKNEEDQETDGWVAHLDQDNDYVEETLTAFLKQNTGQKVVKLDKSVLAVEKVRIEQIMPLRGDLRAVFLSSSEGTDLGFTFSPGYDIHVDSRHYRQELEQMKTYVKEYVKFHYNEFYRDEMARIEKEISTKTNAQDKLARRLDKLKETVSDGEKSDDPKTVKKVDKSKSDMEWIESDIAELKNEIATLEKSVADVEASLKRVNDF